jgi:CubicO group peptidase (beta-lactamase class C family)
VDRVRTGKPGGYFKQEACVDLRPFIEGVEKQNLRVEGILVTRRGEVIGEHRWIPEVPKNVYSVSKSFTSIAVGRAVGEGKLSLRDKVLDAFPGFPYAEGAEFLTLEHLLTMNRGHLEFTQPRSVEEALAHKLDIKPGERFFYDNACTFLASAMVTKAMGKKVRDLLVERLFGPLGIPDPVWAESGDGHTIGATGLELSTSSLARFGRFLLQRGNWEGKQLVSPAWIDGATRTQVPTIPSQNSPDYDIGYGYQFWTCRHGAYRCDGKNGQFVVVFPALDAVVTINSNDENMKPILYAVWDHILPGL